MYNRDIIHPHFQIYLTTKHNLSDVPSTQLTKVLLCSLKRKKEKNNYYINNTWGRVKGMKH